MKCPSCGAELHMLTRWKEIASYLGVSLRTAKKYAAKSGLPVSRLPGGTATIRLDKLEAWIEQRKK